MAGVDAYGIQGFYIPYFYALSDQIGANISGMVYLKRIEGSWSAGIYRYIHHPVMLTSIAVILLVPLGLLSARVLGFSPTTQTFTAFETIAANLCWLPPVVGWMVQKGK
jgi:protein-S-isoprenylcysteine O-methyltransferase Ste14